MAAKITVCICTFRRPDGLADLFASLKTLKTAPDMALGFCVIDNDETPSSKELVAQLSTDFPWPVRYVHEKEPGIPSARNRALEEAGDTGYAVFVDDDETVAEDWLLELWKAARKSGATFVQGPVDMRVEDEKDAWWLRSIFFRQKQIEDGAPRHESWTNNVLIDLEFITQHACRFDEKLRFDGGSDTLFFQDVVREGGHGIYAANALVHEIQPPSRLTWSWGLMRQYRYGVTRANTALLRMPRWKATLYCLIRSAGMVTVGLGYLLTSLYRGRLGIADGAGFIWRGAGVLMGALGARRLEYAR